MIKEFKTSSREEWKDLRHKYIGGSDASAIVGLNPFNSPYALWCEKTDRVPPFEGNLATEVGTFLEEFVAKKFEEVTGKKVRRNNRSMVNDKYPWAIANIDREVVGEDAVLEIKTTSELNLKKFASGEYPAQYYVQIVHYLAVTEKKKGYLAVLIGNKEFLWFEIERDESEINALMKAEEEFFKHIQDDTPPEIDGSKPTTDRINTVLNVETDKEAVIDLNQLDDSLTQYNEICEQIKELEKLKDNIANNIKVKLDTAENGVSLNYKVSFKSASRSTFDVKRYAEDNPGIDLTAYYKSSQYRTFKVIPNKK